MAHTATAADATIKMPASMVIQMAASPGSAGEEEWVWLQGAMGGEALAHTNTGNTGMEE